jgi:hypothetical protein
LKGGHVVVDHRIEALEINHHRAGRRAGRVRHRKPSYDRATFDRIKLALDSTNPPSLSAIAKAERLSKQKLFLLIIRAVSPIVPRIIPGLCCLMRLLREVLCINPNCGVLNHTPLFGFANCTNCFWVLPEPFYIGAIRRVWNTLVSGLAWTIKQRRRLLTSTALAFLLVVLWPTIRTSLLDALDNPSACNVVQRLTASACDEPPGQSNASAGGSTAPVKSETDPRPPLIPSTRTQSRTSSNPPEELWRPYLDWAGKLPNEWPKSCTLGAPDLVDIAKRGDINALMRYEADMKLYEEKGTRCLIEHMDKLEAIRKWFNWNDWCAGWWKAERDLAGAFGSKNTPLMSLAVDIADTLFSPGEEQIRFDERELMIKALISSKRSSPVVIDVIDRITSRSELLASMVRKYGSVGYGTLSAELIRAITKFQQDYPVFTKAENHDLLILFDSFDNDSLSVAAQITVRSTINSDKQKRLLADENVLICH